MIEDVSNRLLRDFSDCLQKTIEAAEATPEAADVGQPVGGFSLSPRAARPDQARVPAALTQSGSSRRKPGSIACGIGDSR